MGQIDIVVPDGSMQEVVTKLLARAGLPVVIKKKRTKVGHVGVDWIKRVVFQRPQEIPQYLLSGHFDVAIVGEDWIANWGYTFPVLLTLPIGRSGNKPVRIVLAVDRESGVERVEDLPHGSDVATEYVELTRRYLAQQGRDDLNVFASYGNTEHKIWFGASAIVDVTESGSSLRENGLTVIAEIMRSNTVIVANPAALVDETKRPYIDCFVRLVRGAFQASTLVLLIANVPEAVLKDAGRIMGGLKGASCSPLLGASGWFALQSVVPRRDEQRVIFDLLQIGVTDILVNRDIPLIMS